MLCARQQEAATLVTPPPDPHKHNMEHNNQYQCNTISGFQTIYSSFIIPLRHTTKECANIAAITRKLVSYLLLRTLL